jgi:Tfp pilus assembly protein PilN
MTSINFASKDYPLLYRIRTGLIVGSAVLLFITAGMIAEAVSLRTRTALIEQDVRERRTALDRVRSLLSERAELVKNLSAMSGITRSRQFSWTRLLSAIESVVPIGAALTTVDFNPDSSALSIEGASRSPEALRTLVIALEKSPLFREPRLKQQTLEKGTISFNVVAVYHQDTAVAVVREGK